MRLARKMALASSVLVSTACLGALAPAAEADTAVAQISDIGFFNYRWSGNAVDLHRGWTYSWVLTLSKKSNGAEIDSHSKEDFVPGTYFTTPTYTQFVDPRSYPPHLCSRLRVHHGRTVASELTADSGLYCTDGCTRIPVPPPADQIARIAP